MSSDAFSFDPAAPAEAMGDTNDSIESSIAQSSPDTGSFSQVTSAQRSESSKRQRSSREDPERESRSLARASSSRKVRSTSVPKTGRSPSVRKTKSKSRSLGGSPSDTKGPRTADEEL